MEWRRDCLGHTPTLCGLSSSLDLSGTGTLKGLTAWVTGQGVTILAWCMLRRCHKFVLSSCRPCHIWQVPQAPPDPILGISEAFKACSDADKLNLGVGAYRTEELKPYVLDVVKKVGQRQAGLPVAGDPSKSRFGSCR